MPEFRSAEHKAKSGRRHGARPFHPPRAAAFASVLQRILLGGKSHETAVPSEPAPVHCEDDEHPKRHEDADMRIPFGDARIHFDVRLDDWRFRERIAAGTVLTALDAAAGERIAASGIDDPFLPLGAPPVILKLAEISGGDDGAAPTAGRLSCGGRYRRRPVRPPRHRETRHRPRGCGSTAGHVPFGLKTGVRFPPIRSAGPFSRASEPSGSVARRRFRTASRRRHLERGPPPRAGRRGPRPGRRPNVRRRT